MSVSDLTDTYNSKVTAVLDKHAPTKKKTITVRPKPKWYSEDIDECRKEKRKAEKKWRKTKLTVHKQIYKEKQRSLNKMIANSKKNFYSDKLSKSQGDQKQLFRCVNELLNNTKSSSLPSHSNQKELADEMSEFFTQKIEKIRKELELFQSKNSKVYAEKESSVFQSVLHPATEEEVRKIIMSSSTTTCALDPIPTQLLKENLDILLPVITKIINRSLSESKVPDSFKLAIILPLLKKDSLDPDVFKHYRPISNLPFLSKVLERVVAVRLDSHSHPNSEAKQSAYKKHHSTETALLKIQNDILLKIDNQECVLLLLLDLSAAFDTVDHTILLERLQTRFGITGAALKWVESYFENRRQQVLINDVKSDEVHLDCNVPQGSVLGPKFFLDYESPLGEIIRSHGVEAHFYADDTQLYLSFKPDKQEIAQGEALTNLQNCISDVRAWMAANFLKLNDDKTELLVLGTPQQLEKVSIESVTVGNCQIEPSPTVRNIGAHFDQHLKMNHQVSLTCKAAWLRLYQIGKIRPYLTESETRSIVHAYVTSKIDQNNSLLLGIADNQIARIQRVQNAAAKLIFRKKEI